MIFKVYDTTCQVEYDEEGTFEKDDKKIRLKDYNKCHYNNGRWFLEIDSLNELLDFHNFVMCDLIINDWHADEVCEYNGEIEIYNTYRE